jgi:Coenzyme PQQ synthesis protein D (PqqD)
MAVSRRTISRHPDVVDAEVDGERVLLHCDTGVYYGLNPVGSFIWPLIEQPVGIDELVSKVAGNFAVDEATCRTDVDSFIEHLSSNGLLA